MKVSSTVLAKFSKNNQCWHLKTCILSLSWKGSYCPDVFNIVSDILKVRVFEYVWYEVYSSSFKSWQFVNIWNTPFFWLYKIIIIMLRGHITLSENCWSRAFIESWCAKIKSVTKTNIYFNTDEIKINLDEILPEWNTHLRQVVRGTNTFNGLVMMPNSLAVSITIYVYAHTNVRR